MNEMAERSILGSSSRSWTHLVSNGIRYLPSPGPHEGHARRRFIYRFPSVSLGLSEDSKKANFDVYRLHFEAPFLQSTTEYYALESKTFSTENSARAYMEKAEDRLREENDRVERYLNSTTRKAVSVSNCSLKSSKSRGSFTDADNDSDNSSWLNAKTS